MVTKEVSMAAAEINEIFKYTQEYELNRIPLGLRLFLKDIADPTYVSQINPDVSLFEQRLMYETEIILGMIYEFYWKDETDVFSKAVESNNIQINQDDELEEQKSLILQIKVPWYKKIFSIFKK